jgi:hypothetical protein
VGICRELLFTWVDGRGRVDAGQEHKERAQEVVLT